MKNKKLFLAVVLIMIILLTGCNTKVVYPRVVINHSVFSSYTEIDIGYPYKYAGFDILDTDTGKDVIVHFTKGDGK